MSLMKAKAVSRTFMATFPTSFRWIHIGPDDDVEPYGGGPEGGGGGPGAPQHSRQGHPGTGWVHSYLHLQCNTPILQQLQNPALHSGLPWLVALMRAWTFAMRGGQRSGSAMQPVCVRRPVPSAACNQGSCQCNQNKGQCNLALPK